VGRSGLKREKLRIKVSFMEETLRLDPEPTHLALVRDWTLGTRLSAHSAKKHLKRDIRKRL
jgi:hypothetical protein